MTEYITSPNNEFIKAVASLKQKKYRDKAGLFIAEGLRMVREAVISKWDIEACLYTKEVVPNKEVEELLTTLQAQGCRLVGIALNVYDKITDTEHGQGIMVVIRKKQYQLKDLKGNYSKNALIVVLDELQDPGNVGTIIRTADAAGCTGVVITSGSADLFSGKTVRATMGSIFHTPIVEGISSLEAVNFFRSEKIKLFSTALDSSEIYYKTDLREAVAIVFGNEGKGVSRELMDNSEKRLHIPIYGQAESLNVAISAAVILYEAARQGRG